MKNRIARFAQVDRSLMTDPRWTESSPVARCIWTASVFQAIDAGGVLSEMRVSAAHRWAAIDDREAASAACQELIDVGLWVEVEGGVRLAGWDGRYDMYLGEQENSVSDGRRGGWTKAHNAGKHEEVAVEGCPKCPSADGRKSEDDTASGPVDVELTDEAPGDGHAGGLVSPPVGIRASTAAIIDAQVEAHSDVADAHRAALPLVAAMVAERFPGKDASGQVVASLIHALRPDQTQPLIKALADARKTYGAENILHALDVTRDRSEPTKDLVGIIIDTAKRRAKPTQSSANPDLPPPVDRIDRRPTAGRIADRACPLALDVLLEVNVPELLAAARAAEQLRTNGYRTTAEGKEMELWVKTAGEVAAAVHGLGQDYVVRSLQQEQDYRPEVPELAALGLRARRLIAGDPNGAWASAVRWARNDEEPEASSVVADELAGLKLSA